MCKIRLILLIAQFLQVGATHAATSTVPLASDSAFAPLQCPGGVCRPPLTRPFLTRPPAGGVDLPAIGPTIGGAAPAAVVRIMNAQAGERTLGSGTLVDKNAQHGLVLTCGHLFRDGVGTVSVAFPDDPQRPYGAKILAIDSTWDLAALLISAPDAQPLAVARTAAAKGEPLRSCGFGPDGRFASNRGRVLGYVVASGTPSAGTLELSGSARQGDSGGPVLNERNELVAVIFGTNGRVVDGTCCLRIRDFLSRFSGRFRGDPGPEQPPADLGGPSLAPDSSALESLKTDLAATKNRLDEAVLKFGGGLEKLAGLKQQIATLREAAAPGKLRALVRDVVGTVVVDKGPDLAALLWPVIGGALGLSTPPTAVFVILKALGWLARRKSAKSTARRPKSSLLNDDYASQLLGVFQQSGRSPIQDATLGREYDQELRSAEQSGDALVARFAKTLRDRVETKFHRIHGAAPTPAEPLGGAT